LRSTAIFPTDESLGYFQYSSEHPRVSPPEKPREQAEHGAEEQAGDDGEVKRRTALVHRDVARQPPEPAQPAGLPKHRAEKRSKPPTSSNGNGGNHQHDADDDKQLSEVVHAGDQNST
jgi:hypothetical protein